jgi:hypothetical protein
MILRTGWVDQVRTSPNPYDAGAPPENILRLAHQMALRREYDDTSAMVFYISIAYWIRSLDIHDETASSTELALQRVGPRNTARLINYLRGDREMASRPLDGISRMKLTSLNVVLPPSL